MRQLLQATKSGRFLTSAGFKLCAAGAALGAALLLSSCGQPSYQDGTYQGVSSPDEDGAIAKVTLTLKDSRVVDCEYLTYQADGKVKDENYAAFAKESGNFGYYQKAQHAVEAMGQYRQAIVQSGTLNGVDKISGATIAYNQFTEAVLDALAKAER